MGSGDNALGIAHDLSYAKSQVQILAPKKKKSIKQCGKKHKKFIKSTLGKKHAVSNLILGQF